MTQSYGWAGKILRVDLTDRKITIVPTSDFEPEKYIGGVGLNSKIFLELGCPKVDGLHPDSPLILSTGPLTGTSGPFTRGTMCAISPQCYPDELFTYSGFGGKFPSELKYAGYDGIVIVGKADKPVCLNIHNSDVEIKDAGDLWGLDTFETQKILTDRYPQASALVIYGYGHRL
jgi:aldehyde:ferredoxin oxidoreductase